MITAKHCSTAEWQTLATRIAQLRGLDVDRILAVDSVLSDGVLHLSPDTRPDRVQHHVERALGSTQRRSAIVTRVVAPATPPAPAPLPRSVPVAAPAAPPGGNGSSRGAGERAGDDLLVAVNAELAMSDNARIERLLTAAFEPEPDRVAREQHDDDGTDLLAEINASLGVH